MKDRYGYLTRRTGTDQALMDTVEKIFSNTVTDHITYTIVIPTYRRPGIIRQTLLSALHQNYQGDYEVLITSDGSFDEEFETEKIIRELAQEHKNISYYRNKSNAGMFNNWNICVDKALGDWVILLPDDDLLSPHYLRILDHFIRHNKYVGMVGVGHHKVVGKTPYKDVAFPKPDKKIKLSYINAMDIYLGDGINVTGMAFEKESLLRLGGFQHDFFPVSDSVCMTNFAVFSRLVRIEFDLAAYRDDENVSHSDKIMKEIIQYAYQIRETLSDNSFLLKCHFTIFKKEILFDYISGAEKNWNISIDLSDMDDTIRGAESYSKIKKRILYLLNNGIRALRIPWKKRRR